MARRARGGFLRGLPSHRMHHSGRPQGSIREFGLTIYERVGNLLFSQVYRARQVGSSEIRTVEIGLKSVGNV